MSHRCSLWAWDLDLPPREKLLLLALADWSNDDGFCFPGQAAISRRCGVGDRAVRELLASLKGKGLIRSASRGKRGGGRGSNIYLLSVPWRENVEDFGERNAADIAGLICG